MHEYVVDGTQIQREVIYYYNSTNPHYDLRYYYDAEGRPSAIRAFTLTTSGTISSDATYYLGTNLQGDVVAIYNASGVKIYSYVYDAWGNTLQATAVTTAGSIIGTLNPFRYRGYYYDSETGWYYLNSRYYSPGMGRFLNADGYVNANGDLIGYNMFAYCSNNPVMYIDSIGTWTFSLGWSFSAYLVAGVSYSFSIAIDGNGNIALQTSKADVNSKGTALGVASVGVNKSYSYTTLNSVSDLNGYAINAGGGVSVASTCVAVGGDAILTKEFEPVGASVNAGVSLGSPVDVHVVISETKTVAQINVVEELKKAWDFLSNFVTSFLVEDSA